MRAVEVCAIAINRLISSNMNIISVKRVREMMNIENIDRQQVYYLGMALSTIHTIKNPRYPDGILKKISQQPNRYKILLKEQVNIEEFLQSYF
jgi:hypothetical protein